MVNTKVNEKVKKKRFFKLSIDFTRSYWLSGDPSSIASYQVLSEVLFMVLFVTRSRPAGRVNGRRLMHVAPKMPEHNNILKYR